MMGMLTLLLQPLRLPPSALLSIVLWKDGWGYVWVAAKGGGGRGGGTEQTAQPSRRGESDGREKWGARDQGSVEDFLKSQRNSQMSFFRLKEKWRWVQLREPPADVTFTEVDVKMNNIYHVCMFLHCGRKLEDSNCREALNWNQTQNLLAAANVSIMFKFSCWWSATPSFPLLPRHWKYFSRLNYSAVTPTCPPPPPWHERPHSRNTAVKTFWGYH